MMTNNWLILLRQVFCRHDLVMNFEPHRMSLRCMSCGHESPGWDIRPPYQMDKTAA